MQSTNPASYREVLASCRTILGPAPRTFGFWERLFYLGVRQPSWCRGQDPLAGYFHHRDQLLETGVIVWGHVVQANSMMFKPGSTDNPGDVVYCTNPKADVDPAALADLAHRLFALKNTRPADPAQARIAGHLTNERMRSFGMPVPASMSPGFPAAMSTILFHRTHLPGKKLGGSLFPLPVMPQPPKYVTVVPAKYWPSALAEFWSGLVRRRREPSA